MAVGPVMPLCLWIPPAADALGVSRATLYELMAEAEIIAFSIRSCRVIPLAELCDSVARLTAEAKADSTSVSVDSVTPTVSPTMLRGPSVDDGTSVSGGDPDAVGAPDVERPPAEHRGPFTDWLSTAKSDPLKVALYEARCRLIAGADFMLDVAAGRAEMTDRAALAVAAMLQAGARLTIEAVG